MNTNKTKSNKKQTKTQANVSQPDPKAETIKLGIDVHLDRYVVVRVMDGGTPQPPQRFKPPEFLLWVAKQITLAEKVFTCYEAGPFGYSLHRKLEKMGITNYVVRPRDWDEYGNPAISSAAFKDPELSVNLESVMARDGRQPADALGSYSGYGLAAITAAHARSLNQVVARDPLPEEPAHGVVYGQKKRGGIAAKLRDGAIWVVTPAQA